MANKLKYVYRKGETPEERIRNIIQPLFSLVSVVDLNYEKCPQPDELLRLLKICKESKESIKLLLGDIPNFYDINPDAIEVYFTQNNTLEDE
jgi:hypothetical protein